MLPFLANKDEYITWITTHLATPKGWKAELAWLVDL